MFAKTSIALAVIVVICSGAVAAEKRENGAASANGGSAPITDCAHGTWTVAGVRCNSAK